VEIALACAVAVGALLYWERRGWTAGIWIAKLGASTLFLAAALRWGALDSRYGRLVLAALALCWLGDALLVPRRSPRLFLAGIGCFLLGHVAYTAAFLGNATASPAVALGGVAVGLGAWRLHGWLRPHLPGEFVLPVTAYLGVISAMVLAALGNAAARGEVAVATGAVLFAVSDVSVARERFVAPGFENAAWGLPLYYAAQLVLASSVR
jgi:uncharacterized membrane protein YhhN